MTGTLSGPFMMLSKLKCAHQNRRPRRTTRPLHSPLVLTPGEREVWSGEGRLAQRKRRFPVFRKKLGVCRGSGRELQQFPPSAPPDRGPRPEARVRAPRPAPRPAKGQVKGRWAERDRAGSARTESGRRRGSGLLRPRGCRSPTGGRGFGKPGGIRAQLGDAGTVRATDSRPGPPPRAATPPRLRVPELHLSLPPALSPARGVPQSWAQPRYGREERPPQTPRALPPQPGLRGAAHPFPGQRGSMRPPPPGRPRARPSSAAGSRGARRRPALPRPRGVPPDPGADPGPGESRSPGPDYVEGSAGHVAPRTAGPGLEA
ncbi:basic salivary proline-rich protein 3-like [Moschus berezovskii]|uniref:basic salivary proline-rich protein 3-like n=1 Tax=Moschus berezovskii TaxID=68408 RepID=UPI002444A8EE|nr:basic salivary proline-rich protein 3-like [Moschus berezovskii]